MLAVGMFGETDDDTVMARQRMMHRMLQPFWYQPSAVYVIARPGEDGDGPDLGVGFICQTGEYAETCAKAVEELSALGVPEAGGSGDRQTLTYTHEGIEWTGVAKQRQAWLFDPDADVAEQLDGKSLFLVHWDQQTLHIALHTEAADSMSEMLAARRDGLEIASKADSADFQFVAAKTDMTDWAFRWFVDAGQFWDMDNTSVTSNEGFMRVVDALELRGIRGVGGTGGYIDKVYARKTYIYSPQGGGEGLRLFKTGGSYKKALAMTPDTSSFLLAGQMDADAVLGLIERPLGPPEEDAPDDEMFQGPARGGYPLAAPPMRVVRAAGADEPDEDSADAEERKAVMDAVGELLAASDGDIAVFMGDVSGMMPQMMMMGAPPVGAVL